MGFMETIHNRLAGRPRNHQTVANHDDVVLDPKVRPHGKVATKMGRALGILLTNFVTEIRIFRVDVSTDNTKSRVIPKNTEDGDF